jgi:hypothetical protein
MSEARFSPGPGLPASFHAPPARCPEGLRKLRRRAGGQLAWAAGSEISVTARLRPPLLGQIDTLVRTLEDLFERLTGPLRRHADAGGHGNGRRVVRDGFARHQHTHAIRHGPGDVHVAVRQDQDELLAAVARQHVHVPDAQLHAFRRLGKHRVPGKVAERVVHLLEVVQVEHQQTEAPLRAPRRIERRVDPVVHGAAVGHPREGVQVHRLFGLDQRTLERVDLLLRGVDLRRELSELIAHAAGLGRRVARFVDQQVLELAQLGQVVGGLDAASDVLRALLEVLGAGGCLGELVGERAQHTLDDRLLLLDRHRCALETLEVRGELQAQLLHRPGIRAAEPVARASHQLLELREIRHHAAHELEQRVREGRQLGGLALRLLRREQLRGQRLAPGCCEGRQRLEGRQGFVGAPGLSERPQGGQRRLLLGPFRIGQGHQRATDLREAPQQRVQILRRGGRGGRRLELQRQPVEPLHQAAEHAPVDLAPARGEHLDQVDDVSNARVLRPRLTDELGEREHERDHLRIGPRRGLRGGRNRLLQDTGGNPSLLAELHEDLLIVPGKCGHPSAHQLHHGVSRDARQPIVELFHSTPVVISAADGGHRPINRSRPATSTRAS